MQSRIIVGNASLEGEKYRGWFMGHFITPSEDPRATEAIEVKWGSHPAGERRQMWAVNTVATTLSVLITGHFRLEFPDRKVVLTQPGDYVLWLPNVSHCWEAEEASLILTIRYPSIPEAAQPSPPAE